MYRSGYVGIIHKFISNGRFPTYSYISFMYTNVYMYRYMYNNMLTILANNNFMK